MIIYLYKMILNRFVFGLWQIVEVVNGEQFKKLMPMAMDDNMKEMMIQTMFTMADKNRDGHLDPSEFTKLSKMGEKAMKKNKPKSDEL